MTHGLERCWLQIFPEIQRMLRTSVGVQAKMVKLYSTIEEHFLHPILAVVVAAMCSPCSNNNPGLFCAVQNVGVVSHSNRIVFKLHYFRIGRAKGKDVGHAKRAISPCLRKANAAAYGGVIFYLVGGRWVKTDELNILCAVASFSVVTHTISVSTISAHRKRLAFVPLTPECVAILSPVADVGVRRNGYSHAFESGPLPFWPCVAISGPGIVDEPPDCPRASV